mmetsp:Transcript_40201/g.95514  ORF Transcript_40201/g.95514 Transcript_40201/m.95514 type:complete len:275 (+) Transcript_40201:657-1481(+)
MLFLKVGAPESARGPEQVRRPPSGDHPLAHGHPPSPRQKGREPAQAPAHRVLPAAAHIWPWQRWNPSALLPAGRRYACGHHSLRGSLPKLAGGQGPGCWPCAPEALAPPSCSGCEVLRSQWRSSRREPRGVGARGDCGRHLEGLPRSPADGQEADKPLQIGPEDVQSGQRRRGEGRGHARRPSRDTRWAGARVAAHGGAHLEKLRRHPELRPGDGPARSCPRCSGRPRGRCESRRGHGEAPAGDHHRLRGLGGALLGAGPGALPAKGGRRDRAG